MLCGVNIMILLPINMPNGGGMDNKDIKFYKTISNCIIILAVLGLIFAFWGAFIRPDGQSNAEWFINEFILMHRWIK